MARRVTVSTISYAGPGQVENYIQQALKSVSEMVAYAASGRPDVVLLPETFATLGTGGKAFESRQGLDGEIVSTGAKWAKKYRTYVAVPLVLEQKARRTNSIVLLDRKGEVNAVYAKMFPTIGEIENGITPGTEAVVAETDFGRLGFLICFDLNFDELKDMYKQKRAELILFASMFRGGLITRRWAYDNHCWLAAATPHEHSLIVNPIGRVIKESKNYERIITADINLDSTVLHIDYNMPKAEDLRRKYRKRVEIEIVSPEGIFLLSANHPRKDVHDLVKEAGMEPIDEYFDRARAVRKKALKSRRGRKSRPGK